MAPGQGLPGQKKPPAGGPRLFKPPEAIGWSGQYFAITGPAQPPNRQLTPARTPSLPTSAASWRSKALRDAAGVNRVLKRFGSLFEGTGAARSANRRRRFSATSCACAAIRPATSPAFWLPDSLL